jgi:hypothetical protein
MNKKFLILSSYATLAVSALLFAQDTPQPEPKGGGGVSVHTSNRPHPGQSSASAQAGRRVTRDVMIAPGGGNVFFNRDRAGSRSLIVRSSEEPESKPLKEDLAIMSRIIEKSMAEELQQDTFKASGIDLLLHNARSIRNFYIEGYGALFVLNVNIPLAPPETIQKKKEKQVDPEDSTWEQTRNELLGRKHPTAQNWKGHHPKQREFDQADVDHLRDVLIQALHNASNMHLKADDWVTIAVTGPAGDEQDEQFNEVTTGPGPEVRLWSAGEGRAGVFGEAFDGETATMVLRVKKSDIDKLAKEKDGEDLKKKVSITVY